MPTGHTVQLDADGPENEPAEQLMQLVAPLSEYVPAMHDVQLLDELAPSVDDDVPELQFVQLVDELASLYVPTAHSMQLAEAAAL